MCARGERSRKDQRGSSPPAQQTAAFERLLTNLKLKSKAHVFHSLRHSFKDAMRDTGITEETQNRYLGHATRHVGERYGSGTLTWAQAHEMKKVTTASSIWRT